MIIYLTFCSIEILSTFQFSVNGHVWQFAMNLVSSGKNTLTNHCTMI